MNKTFTPWLMRLAAPVVLTILALQCGLSRAQTAASAGIAADSGGLAEIVVTARRRAENLQDVPLAVTAIGADTLQQNAVASLADLSSFVPNMKISTDRATSSTINVYIRGVGQSDPLWGFEPGVGVYIDDVYLARPQAALLDVYDVDRLEILRGPQGTLYGKNTIAGAIKYVTRDIVGPASVTAAVTGGNYAEHDEKLSASTPVVADHLYVGVAVASSRRPALRPAPTIGSVTMSRIATCLRDAPMSRRCGARVRNSKSCSTPLKITRMLREASD
jgi:iron complex outermembrane recepter protein